MTTGDGGLLVLGGSSGSLVVSLHGLVVSVVSCSSLPRLPLVSSSAPARLLLNLACAGPFNRGPNQSA